MLKIGDKAPDITLPDAQEQSMSLQDFKDKWVVIYFYPKDNTPGCTIEAIDFTVRKDEFDKLNTVVIGISKDSCQSHAKFIEKRDLTVLLLSDPDHKVQDAYGVWQPKKFMGREFLGTLRSTFIVDPKRTIRYVNYKVSAKGHAQEMLETVKELQKA